MPLDFHSAALAGFGLSSAGISTATGLVLSNRYAAETAKLAADAYSSAKANPGVGESAEHLLMRADRAFKTATEARTLHQAFVGLEEFRELSAIVQLSTAGPAVLIEVAGIVLAVDRHRSIHCYPRGVRPKLVHAVEIAQEPIDLKAFYAEPDGKDQLTYFWSKAMDVKTPQEDPTISKARAV